MATAEAKKNSQLDPVEWLEGDELLPVVQEGRSMLARVRHIRAPLEQRLDALEEEVLIKGGWDMTGTTVIPYADPARDAGLETIDPQSVEVSRFRIVAGGVPVYGGAAYMHHQSSDRVATNTGDLREAWTELVDFGADNGAINVILAVFADEAMTAQDLIDAFFQNPAAAEREFYYFSWMWSPGRTNYSIATRSGAGRTAVGDSLSGNALPVGTPLALRMDWATGRPSIFRQDNATDLLTATNCQLQAPAGTRFRPWTFVMTMGTDGIASMQAVPLQYNLGNSLASGFIGIGDAVRPDGAQVGDAFVVSAPGNYGGKSAALGNVVMLHPTINDLIVLATDPSQYVTKDELSTAVAAVKPQSVESGSMPDGTLSLVMPDGKIKRVYPGPGISLIDQGEYVEIQNSAPDTGLSGDTVTNSGGTGVALVAKTGNVATIRRVLAGAGIDVTDDGADVVIALESGATAVEPAIRKGHATLSGFMTGDAAANSGVVSVGNGVTALAGGASALGVGASALLYNPSSSSDSYEMKVSVYEGFTLQAVGGITTLHPAEVGLFIRSGSTQWTFINLTRLAQRGSVDTDLAFASGADWLRVEEAGLRKLLRSSAPATRPVPLANLFDYGIEIPLRNVGPAAITFEASPGDTLLAPGGNLTLQPYESAVLLRSPLDSTTWVMLR